jgi:hypothetical protein
MLAQELMEFEVSQHVGADRYEGRRRELDSVMGRESGSGTPW